MQGDGLSGRGMVARGIAALALVYGTFNPEGYSFYHWVVAPVVSGRADAARANLPVKVLVGLGLVGLWLFFLKSTRRSLGWKGALLVLGIVAALAWALIDWKLLNPSSSRAITHVALVGLALVLAVGMSWSHLSRRISGQVDTDETD